MNSSVWSVDRIVIVVIFNFGMLDGFCLYFVVYAFWTEGYRIIGLNSLNTGLVPHCY